MTRSELLAALREEASASDDGALALDIIYMMDDDGRDLSVSALLALVVVRDVLCTGQRDVEMRLEAECLRTGREGVLKAGRRVRELGELLAALGSDLEAVAALAGNDCGGTR